MRLPAMFATVATSLAIAPPSAPPTASATGVAADAVGLATYAAPAASCAGVGGNGAVDIAALVGRTIGRVGS
jgi:hypothetical protein